MKHVAPERWAERGRVSDAEREAMDRHADGCEPCAEARRRVGSALSAMEELGTAPSPALNWEHIGARLYWSVSSEMRAKDRDRGGGRRLGRRIALATTAGVAAAAGAALVLGLRSTGTTEKVAVVQPAPRASRVIEVSMIPRVTPAPPVIGLVTFLQGDVHLANRPMDPGAEVRAGDVIQTGDGRLAVQFGDRSAFALAPRTRLEIRSFDDKEIVLAVEGTVELDVEKRREGQRLQVRAGDRSVEVRGTAFRVGNADGALDVTVARGRVAVIEGEAQVEVPAGSRLSVAAATPLAAVPPRALISPAAAASTRTLRIPTVPNWTDVATLRSHTSLLAVSAPARTGIQVDGVEVGKGTFLLRTTPGRHLVEGPHGGRWVEVEQGVPATATLIGRPTESERPGQVDAELRLNRRKLADCGDRVRKAEPGFAGSMQVEIGVESDGSVRFVAPVEGFEDPDVERCVLDVIRTQFVFPAGSKATVQKVIRF